MEEDDLTEAVDKDQAVVEETVVASEDFAAEIVNVRLLERLPQRLGALSRRAKPRPPSKIITINTSITGTCVSVAALMFPSGTPARHAAPCVVVTDIRKDVIAKITRSIRRRGTGSARREHTKYPPNQSVGGSGMTVRGNDG